MLLFTYLGQYWRGAYFSLGPKAGAKRVAAFQAGDSGYGALQSPAALLFGGSGGKPKAS